MIMFYDLFAFFKHSVMVVRNRLFHCNSNNNKTKTKQKNRKIEELGYRHDQ